MCMLAVECYWILKHVLPTFTSGQRDLYCNITLVAGKV